jgi:pimeloyl-ACP methyl ester carboxylesterase
LVHGTGGDSGAWAAQQPLATHYQLRAVDRRGYGASPARSPSYGFAEESAEIAALLGVGAHLVGQSYDGVIALLVAARRPEVVRSLTVSEPPAFAVARGHPDVEWVIGQLRPLFDDPAHFIPEEYDAQFDERLGFAHEPQPRSPQEQKNLEAARWEHAPWSVEIALDQLTAAPFPKLVISGGWGGATATPMHRAGRAFTAVCDTLERRLDAARAVITGAGHAIPRTGTPYNDRLAAFLASAPRI